MAKEELIEMRGRVSEVLPDSRYRVTLDNGHVLIAGGGKNSSFTMLKSTEVYDPATGNWTQAGSLAVARYSHSATLLADGTVLVAGGTPAAVT